MTGAQFTALSAEQQLQYREQGYFFPIRVFDDAETAGFRTQFMKYMDSNKERLKGLPPRQHFMVTSQTHHLLNWVYRMASHPRVLDAVESVLGPNIVAWSSQWFPKMPGDMSYISWHQDATYWGLHPLNITTAWIALSESTPENGCMRVVGGTHKGALLPQRETFAWDNALSRGQEIAVEVDESRAVDLVLRPGEMSLHHVAIVHGSNANGSDKPRIGLAVRYITPEVVQEGAARQMALLVRGKDEYGHFEFVNSPQDDVISPEDEGIHSASLKGLRTNIMPK